MLDPSPYNELGKGILDPAVECFWRLASPARARQPRWEFHLRTATTPIDVIAVNVLKPAKLQINGTLVLIMRKTKKVVRLALRLGYATISDIIDQTGLGQKTIEASLGELCHA